MNIGIDITPVIYETTGVGVYTRELVFHLLKGYPKDKFVLFASTLRGQRKLWDYLKILSIFTNWTAKIYPFPPLVTEAIWNRLHQFPVENLVGHVDIFHAWDWQQPPAKTAKMITTIHDLTIIKFPEHHHPKTVAVHTRRLTWVAKEADAIIADSQTTKNDITNLTLISAEKIHVIHLAAGDQYSQFRNQPADIKQQEIHRVRQKYNLPKKFVLSPSARDPRKNTPRVIKASPLPVVVLDGSIPFQDLPAVYAAASIFVYPSLYEGFGLPTLEAMSIGTPVVTSNRGSLAEIAGTAAVIVNPESIDSISSGITTALENRNKLIKLGIIHSQSFSWHKTAQQTMQVYQRL